MAAFELRAGPDVGELTVASFRGCEAMNQPFRFDIRVLARDVDHAHLGQEMLQNRASLRIQLPSGDARYVHGIVVESEAEDRVDGQVKLRLRLAPRLAMLKRRRTSRIFQDQSPREIIDGILDLESIAREWRTSRDMERRTYCVQYDETDYNFVIRLCREEGIFFSFDHPLVDPSRSAMPEEVLVLCDGPEQCQPIDGRADLEIAATTTGALIHLDHHAQRFSLRDAPRTKAVLRSAYDFRKPQSTQVDAASVLGVPRLESDTLRSRLVDSDLTVHEHRGSREQAPVNGLSTKLMLEAARARARVGSGRSTCRRLLPGRRFHLANHSISDLDREYVITRVVHEGRAPFASSKDDPLYSNRFETVPASVAYRMEREPRAGFDSIHIGPSWGLGPDLLTWSRESTFKTATEVAVLRPADWKLDDIVPAPCGGRDTLHLAWRWSDTSLQCSTFGWNQTGPYKTPGAPMVPLDQDVSIRMSSPTTLLYDARATKPESLQWTYFVHHGGAYALDDTESTALAGASGMELADGYLKLTGKGVELQNVGDSWTFASWRMRFSVAPPSPLTSRAPPGTKLEVLERVIHVNLEAAMDL